MKTPAAVGTPETVLHIVLYLSHTPGMSMEISPREKRKWGDIRVIQIGVPLVVPFPGCALVDTVKTRRRRLLLL